MSAWSRRQILVGLAAVGACARRAPSPTAADLPADSIRLGWRWAPGLRRAWRTTLTHTQGDWTATTTEEWVYLATELSPGGVVQLTGELRGLGGGLRHPQEPTDPALKDAVRQPSSPGPVRVELRLNGRIERCSVSGFAAELPHRLLGLQLPTDPLPLGQVWNEHGLARAFALAIPPEIDVTSTSWARLADLSGSAQARLTHQATLRTHRLGPGVEVQGETLWDLDQGSIERRELHARLLQSPGSTLSIRVQALPTG